MKTRHSASIAITLAILLCVCFAATAQPQTAASTAKVLSSWIALDSPPGWEYRATDVISKSLPGWQRDRLGNLILRKGSGSPRRVVACGIDRPTFAVTEITDNGYLRLRESGSLRSHPLWIQFHEGQRIRVLTRKDSVAGVVIVKSTHLQRGRNPNAPVTTLEDVWVDVGATSKADVSRLGIQMLDPVVRDFPTWSYGDFVSGPSAASRVGCAAVVAASQGNVTSGETTFMITTLRSFGNDGLEAGLRSLGRVDEVTVVDLAAESSSSTEGVTKRTLEKPQYLPDTTGLTSLTMLSPRVRYPRTLVESVQLGDADALLTAVQTAAAVTVDRNAWVAVPVRIPPMSATSQDPLASTASVLSTLADAYSVSGHERDVREAVIASLPSWARSKATTDSEGNLIVEAGPDRDPVMFIAHLDEVGFEITNIANDGTVSLRARGGLFPSLWEGQTARLHFDSSNKPSLQGVFVPRDSANTKQPEALTAWFGTDAAGLKQLGVTTGMSVTSDKRATRLGASRFTARALDDRAGSTALVMVARKLDPSALKHKVILSWSVREETGLEGAIALAKRYGSAVKRVFSVDTFVSSDSPAESTRFANTPLGSGAVIRGLDNSAVAAPAELDRIINIARAQNIPLQIGATNGGTDGSTFVPYGAIHVSLSWPGRYSHSPVEVLDLRDLQALERLIYALALAPG